MEGIQKFLSDAAYQAVSAVAEVIKTNETQTITAALLQSTLNSIIDQVGGNRQFVGIATPTTAPGIPDGNVFYLANTPGTYSNFGGVTVTNGIYLLYNNTDNSWSISTLPDIQQIIGSNTNSSISQNAVKNALIETINIVVKISSLLNGFSIVQKTPTTIKQGYYLDAGGNLQGGGTWPNYHVEVYQISDVPKCLIVGKTGGSVAAIGYYADANLTQKISVGIYSPTNVELIIADTTRNAPSSANYVAITVNETIASIDRIKIISLDAFATSDNYITRLINSVFGDGNFVQQTINNTLLDKYIGAGGVLVGGNTSYKVDVYAVTAGQKYNVKGTTQGNMVVYAFYSDSACTNVIGYGNTITNVLTNIAVKVTVPSGANYIGLSKLKTGNTLALFSYTELYADKIAELQTQITSLSNELNTVIDTIYDDTNTVVATSEIRTGYFLETDGKLYGGGTFPGYAIDLYPVTAGSKYKLLGTSAGTIATAAFFTDSNLGTLVSVVNPHSANTVFNVDLKITAPTNATIIVVTRRTDIAIPTKLYTYVENNVDKIAALKNANSMVVCWGDSLTAGAGGSGTTYPSVLQQKIGSNYIVSNAGVGGENTYTIAARQGGEPMLLAADVVLPSTTDYVTATLTNSLSKSINPLLQGGSGTINPCYIDGIECTLNWTGSLYQIKRNVAGASSRTLKAGTLIVTNYMKTKRKPYAMVIWIGTNGTYTDGNDLADQYDKMIRFAGINNFVIVGMHGYQTPDLLISIEQIFQKKFGANFINWREYVSTHGLEDAGITPMEADITAMAQGKCPPSLLSDSIHLVAAGYTLLGNLIYQRFKDLGIF